MPHHTGYYLPRAHSAGVLAGHTAFLQKSCKEGRHSRGVPPKGERKRVYLTHSFLCPVGQISLHEELIPPAVPSGPLAAPPDSTPGGVSFHLSLEEEERPSEDRNQTRAGKMETGKEI